MQQFFMKEPVRLNDAVSFTGEQEHHLQVLRVRKETVRLVYQKQAYFATAEKTADGYRAEVFAADPAERELPYGLTVAASLIERSKMEYLLQKCTEIGVTRFIPLDTKRVAYRISSERQEHILERWNSVLLEAAQQCRRNQIPVLESIKKLDDLRNDASEIKLAAYENADAHSLHVSQAYTGRGSVILVIGPEGGFEPEEIQKLQQYGYSSLTLGPRILRAETAAVYASAVAAEMMEREEQ